MSLVITQYNSDGRALFLYNHPIVLALAPSLHILSPTISYMRLYNNKKRRYKLLEKYLCLKYENVAKSGNSMENGTATIPL